MHSSLRTSPWNSARYHDCCAVMKSSRQWNLPFVVFHWWLPDISSVVLFYHPKVAFLVALPGQGLGVYLSHNTFALISWLCLRFLSLLHFITKFDPFWPLFARFDQSEQIRHLHVHCTIGHDLLSQRPLVEVQVTWCLTGAASLLKQIPSKCPWWSHIIISSWSSMVLSSSCKCVCLFIVHRSQISSLQRVEWCGLEPEVPQLHGSKCFVMLKPRLIFQHAVL